ncbi:MAG: MliC family protein [Ectothiorhodospiraceae bacterium]|nr:MliC family protein [Ectothiorhodospiraceae bacterium]
MPRAGIPAFSSPWIPVLVASLTLAACQASPPPSPVPAPPTLDADQSAGLAFQCGDERVEIVPGDEQMLLRLPRGDEELRRGVAASGARYSGSGGTEFWSKDDEAMLVVDGGEPQTCAPTEARSPWVQARDQGVLLRAVGQEPGWLAEVSGDDEPTLRLVLDYGDRELVLRQVTTTGAVGSPGFRYQGEADGEAVQLDVRSQPCQDVMSGHHFPMRAVLTVGGRQLNGCAHYWP